MGAGHMMREMQNRSLADRLSLETAAGHLSTSVPVTGPNAQVGDVRASLASQRYESATHVAVCERDRFVGVLRIEDLLAAAPDVRVSDLMDQHPPFVGPGVDQEVAAWRAVQHGESALAVVDDAGRFQGFIPPHRLLAVLLEEHEEDMTRLGGFLRGSWVARTASEESVLLRFWHRIPWLLIGLAGALLTASTVAAFEDQLSRSVMLVFFIPGIVYLADAVGTQTETLIVRGFSVGVGIRQFAGKELLAVACVGLVLSFVFYPAVLWLWRSREVALAVSLSIFVASLIATLVGIALPWVFQRLGKDPAFGSGPLATVVQDFLSILVYFTIATAVVP